MVRRWTGESDFASDLRAIRVISKLSIGMGGSRGLNQKKVAMNFEELDRQEREWAERASKVQASAAQAYDRLMRLAESSSAGQVHTVARFLASTFDGQAFPLDPFDLRAVEVTISDDMLLCLDALRWGKADLYKLVPDGNARLLAICQAWGLKWPESQ
ncbi:hypothetical protein D7S65_14425 [Ralstonia insidiosa]|nr:hypothetical protein [Ralstonia insidiosa]MBA9952706.1 hypothetical protein [Ralstonia insidiosa]MBA9969081.1 hypothetical protein [Ralstonia insidiosa]